MFRLNMLLFRLTARHEYLIAPESKIEKANSVLRNISDDPGISCITENNINIKFDVQIIVPIYNAEKYLRACIDSVVNASEKYTYCLTCINDGSSDSSAEILKEYENNPNVEIITQENKGFSGARNTGLKNLKGKYIAFLDSDDCLDWKGVEKMLDVAFDNDLDLVQGSYTIISETGKVKQAKPQKEKLVEDATKREFFGQPWAKVFKVNLFSNLKFPDFYWFEDSLMSSVVYPKVEKSMKISDNVYYYRDNSAGITKKAPYYPKCIDSFWITKQLDSDRKILGMENNQNYYEYILHMVKLTYERTRFQSEDVKKAIFIVFADFIKSNFANFKTQDNKNRILEKAIYALDYGYYKKCCEYVLFE